jgi:hypothetical protein
VKRAVDDRDRRDRSPGVGVDAPVDGQRRIFVSTAFPRLTSDGWQR